MFDDRMDEELEWVQLDLDEVSHDVSGNGLIVPICHQIGTWGIDGTPALSMIASLDSISLDHQSLVFAASRNWRDHTSDA